MRCRNDGKPGWRYGNQACYTYPPGDDAAESAAKKKAIAQAIAIGGGKAPSDLAEEPELLRLVEREFQQECAECGKTKSDGSFRPDGRFAANLSPVCWECERLAKLSGDDVVSQHREYAESFTDKPWDGSASRFTDEQYARSCLIDRGGDAPTKERCSLPVREPDGTVNRNALRNVASVLAGGRGGVKNASAEALAAAKTKLRALMKAAGIETSMSEREYLDTVDLRGIDVLATGGPFHGKGSPDDGDHFSREELETIARANNELADEIHPPVKIGHNRAQRLLRNSGLYTDELPAAGWLSNFRVEGGKLLVDIKDVPRKLASLIPHAFRKRSVELSRVTRQDGSGKVYDPVISAMALLGAKSPAVRKLTDIRNLDDVMAWYSLEREPSVAYSEDDFEVEPRVFLDVVVAAPDERALADAVRVELEKQRSRGRDTRRVKTEAKERPQLSDEQVETFAEAFEIEEDDDAKRREAVVAKIAEFVGETPPTPPTPAPPAPPPPPESTKDEPVSKTEFAETLTAMFEQREARRRSEANVDSMIGLGAVDPAERDSWLKLFAEDYDAALTILMKQRPDPTRASRAFGGDENGDRAKKGREFFDSVYDDYARATGVPRVVGVSAKGGES